jgi:hypothetical protein
MSRIKAYPKSLRRYFFFKCQEQPPTALHMAYLGDTFIAEAQMFIAQQIAKSLGYQLRRRKEITDWVRRHSPKTRIGKYTYYLIRRSISPC